MEGVVLWKREPYFLKYFPERMGPVAAPGLRIGGGGAFEGQTHIWGGGKIEFLKRYGYLPMPLSQDFCPHPQEIHPPSKGGRYS